MSQQQQSFYEVALYGEFLPRDLKSILNRLTLNSESSQAMHTREVIFEPVWRDPQAEPVLLRAKKELLEADPAWIIYSHLKPEPARLHPEATVRPWATCNIVGDALAFASSLGYNRRSQIYKRGFMFRRGCLVIQMFQQEQADPKTQKPIPAHVDTLWEVEVRNVIPLNNNSEPTLAKAVEAVVEIQLLMKGLLDLRRKDG